MRLDWGYRLDLRVDRKVIIEIKAVDYMPGVHYAQVLTYLKLCNCKLGLLMNFNTVKLKEGIHRMVNGLWFYSAFVNIFCFSFKYSFSNLKILEGIYAKEERQRKRRKVRKGRDAKFPKN